MASSSRLRACVAGFVAQTSAGGTFDASAVRSGIPSLLSARPGAHSFRFVSLLEHPVEFAKVLLCSALKVREVDRIFLWNDIETCNSIAATDFSRRSYALLSLVSNIVPSCLCNDTANDQSSSRGARVSDLGATVVSSSVQYRKPRREARQRFHGIGLYDSRFRGCSTSR